jgi:hypothetical protein
MRGATSRAVLTECQITLAALVTAVGCARAFTTRTLAGWALPVERVEVAELLVSELVTNAVKSTGMLTAYAVSGDCCSIRERAWAPCCQGGGPPSYGVSVGGSPTPAAWMIQAREPDKQLPDTAQPDYALLDRLALLRVRLALLAETVLIEVWDEDPTAPRLGAPGLDQENGRGLLLVDALSVRWDVRRPPGHRGKAVWCELARREEPAGD